MVIFAMFRFCLILLPLVSALFNQTKYKFDYHHGIAEDFNPEFAESFKFGFNKFNRTARAFDLKIRFLKNIDSIKVLLQAWKFIDNQYKSFTPLTLVFDICSAFKTDLFGIATLAKQYGNFTNCPLDKGFYVIRQFIPDDSLFPPNLPLGQYKFSLTFNTHDKLLFKISVAAQIKNRKEF